MEARANPRVKLSVPVGMFASGQDAIVKRVTGDISTGGLFVKGGSWGRTGMELQIVIDPDGIGGERSAPMTGEVVRQGPSGFAVQFKYLGEAHLRRLEELIWPDWDGSNLFEGMMILVMREQVTDLASWMHLTSILCCHYKRLCCVRSSTTAP